MAGSDTRDTGPVAEQAPGTGVALGVAPAALGPTRCPLCGSPNACAMETARATGEPQPTCWCTQMDFSAELLARVPVADRNKACICAGCARQAQRASGHTL